MAEESADRMCPVELTLRAQRQLKALPSASRRRVAECIDRLGSGPSLPEATKLAGNCGIFRLRVGEHSVVYQLAAERLVVLEVLVSDAERILESMQTTAPIREP